MQKKIAPKLPNYGFISILDHQKIITQMQLNMNMQYEQNLMKLHEEITNLKTQLETVTRQKQELEKINHALKQREKILGGEISLLRSTFQVDQNFQSPNTIELDQQNVLLNPSKDSQNEDLEKILNEFSQCEYVSTAFDIDELCQEEQVRKKRKIKDMYSISIYKVLQQISPDQNISTKAIKLLSSLLELVTHRITQEAVSIVEKDPQSNALTTAIRKTFPQSLAEQAIEFANQKMNNL